MSDDRRYRVYVEQEGLNPYWIPCNHDICNEPHSRIGDGELLKMVQQFISRKDITKFAVIRY